jgi:hypothetical protein
MNLWRLSLMLRTGRSEYSLVVDELVAFASTRNSRCIGRWGWLRRQAANGWYYRASL